MYEFSLFVKSPCRFLHYNYITLQREKKSVYNISLKLKAAAHSLDEASNTVKYNILLILDAIVEPAHLREESTFNMEENENILFSHTFVFKVVLPVDKVRVEEKETMEEWKIM